MGETTPASVISKLEEKIGKGNLCIVQFLINPPGIEPRGCFPVPHFFSEVKCVGRLNAKGEKLSQDKQMPLLDGIYIDHIAIFDKDKFIVLENASWAQRLLYGENSIPLSELEKINLIPLKDDELSGEIMDYNGMGRTTSNQRGISRINIYYGNDAAITRHICKYPEAHKILEKLGIPVPEDVKKKRIKDCEDALLEIYGIFMNDGPGKNRSRLLDGKITSFEGMNAPGLVKEVSFAGGSVKIDANKFIAHVKSEIEKPIIRKSRATA